MDRGGFDLQVAARITCIDGHVDAAAATAHVGSGNAAGTTARLAATAVLRLGHARDPGASAPADTGADPGTRDVANTSALTGTSDASTETR